MGTEAPQGEGSEGGRYKLDGHVHHQHTGSAGNADSDNPLPVSKLHTTSKSQLPSITRINLTSENSYKLLGGQGDSQIG